MKSLYSMFLSQAYQDCWDDYNRSVKLKNFPGWDYVILTASNDQQAEGVPQADRRAEGVSSGRDKVCSDPGPGWRACGFRRCDAGGVKVSP